MMKLLQLFDSSMLTSYAPTENTEAAATFRSTLMVTALSYAFSQDLRSEFESLNFLIDNYAFEQLYEMATAGGAKLSPTSESFGSCRSRVHQHRKDHHANQLPARHL